MNIQPPEPFVRTASSLSVHSIFHTIQGEGPFTGHRAVFIRLAGCNIQCPGCDTDYTSHRRNLTVNEIVSAVNDLLPPCGPSLVVLTGGEPFRQPVEPLLVALVQAGYFVQVETNGTLRPPSLEFAAPPILFESSFRHWNVSGYNLNPTARLGVYIVVSPKTMRINERVLKDACAFKYVLTDGDICEDGLPNRVLAMPGAHRVARPRCGAWVYVQPCDEQDEAKNKRNLKAAMNSCKEHGFILQLQIHKMIGVE